VIQAFIHAKSYELKWYWVVLDMVNIFQALAVFIIFVCNRPSHQVCSGGHGMLLSFKNFCFTLLVRCSFKFSYSVQVGGGASTAA